MVLRHLVNMLSPPIMTKAIFLTLLLAGCSAAPTVDRAERRGPIDADSIQQGEAVPFRQNLPLHLACCVAHWMDAVEVDTHFRLRPLPRRVTETEILLEDGRTESRLYGPEIQQLLSVVDSAQLVVYAVQGVRGGYKVVTAPYFHPTGLATNFTHWLVLKGNNQVRIHFQSLLDMPRAAFLRQGSQSFEILMAELSGEFFHGDRDWDRMSSYQWFIYSIKEQQVEQSAVSIADCSCDEI